MAAGSTVDRMALNLRGTGIWSGELRRHPDRAEVADAAAELEQLGYSALWFPGGDARGAFDTAGGLPRAAASATVATGILSIGLEEAEPVAAERAQLHDA